MKAQRLPPFGKDLNARLRFGNMPLIVVVCVGVDAWSSAKKWKQSQDNDALVLPPSEDPESFKWPVRNCVCVIEWSTGPTASLIVKLIQCLLFDAAKSVTVWPTFVDYSSTTHLFKDGTWHRVREQIRTYANNGIDNVAR
jgi:hypothetical protein